MRQHALFPSTTRRRTARRATALAISLSVLSVTALAGAAAVASTAGASGPAAEAPNLLPNPGFETDLTGWISPTPPQHLDRVADAHTGSFAAQLSSEVAGTVALKDHPNTMLDGLAGAHFVASAWVKAPTAGVTAVVRLREVKSTALLGQQGVQLALKDTAWHQIQVAYTTVGAASALDFNVLARGLTPGHALLVDDLALTGDVTTPTPSTTPTPTPTPTPTVTATPPVGTTVFGSSIYQEPGQSFEQAYARQKATFGALPIDRVYYGGLPAAWPGIAGYSGGTVAVSFKVNPSQVLTGMYDTTLKAWFDEAPRDRDIYWTYYHEPEDNIANGDFTAADYRAAWQRISALAATSANAKLHATLILMCFTLEPASGRAFADYYPGAATIDVLGWDCYNANYSKGTYIEPAQQFGKVLATSEATGKPFGIGEFNSHLVAGDTGAGRAAWLTASAAWLTANHALFVSIFDSPVGGDYRLTDSPSQVAWRTVVAAS